MPVEPILHEAVRGTVGRQRTPFPETFPEECWAAMDDANLGNFFELRFPVLQSCPLTCEAGSDRQIDESWKPPRSCEVTRHSLEERAWKAFCILTVLFLRHPQGEARVRNVQEV